MRWTRERLSWIEFKASSLCGIFQATLGLFKRNWRRYMTIFMLACGLFLLLAGGVALVQGASGIASRFGVPPLVVGLTVVAFGTSAPELMVNIVGAWSGETELAFGNVSGSNLANLGLVLGTAAIISPMLIEGQIVRRELPLLLLATSILLVMTLDGPLDGLPAILSRADGLILLMLFSIFVYITVNDFVREERDAVVDNLLTLGQSMPKSREVETRTYWIYVLGGIIALGVGGQFSVVYGSLLATSLGVSPVIVGLLVVAIGTSLPELVTSIIAALRQESDLCVGNVIGSNLFNSLVVLPVSTLVRPLPVPEGGEGDVFAVLLFTAALLPIFFFGRSRMGRPTGTLLLASYCGYMTWRVMS